MHSKFYAIALIIITLVFLIIASFFADKKEYEFSSFYNPKYTVTDAPKQDNPTIVNYNDGQTFENYYCQDDTIYLTKSEQYKINSRLTQKIVATDSATIIIDASISGENFNIFCENTLTIILFNNIFASPLSDMSIIKAKTLTIFAYDASIVTTGPALEADTINIYGKSLEINSPLAISCQNLYVFGIGLNLINSQKAIVAQDVTILGGKLDIKSCANGIDCASVTLDCSAEISASVAGICANKINLSGHVVILADTPVFGDYLSVSGNFFASGKTYGIRANKNIKFDCVLSVIRSSATGSMPIDEYKNKIEYVSGLIVAEGDNLCNIAPNGKFLAFGVKSGKSLVLASKNYRIAYVPQKSDQVMIISSQKFSYFCQNARIDYYESCFFGCVQNIRTANMSERNISYNHPTYDASLVDLCAGV